MRREKLTALQYFQFFLQMDWESDLTTQNRCTNFLKARWIPNPWALPKKHGHQTRSWDEIETFIEGTSFVGEDGTTYAHARFYSSKKVYLVEVIFCNSSLDPSKAVDVLKIMTSCENEGILLGPMPDHLCEEIKMFKKKVPAIGLVHNLKSWKGQSV